MICALTLPHLASSQFFQCPPPSRPVGGGGGTMCQCPDGSMASISGCSAASRSAPAIPRGSIPCGNGYCSANSVCVQGACRNADAYRREQDEERAKDTAARAKDQKKVLNEYLRQAQSASAASAFDRLFRGEGKIGEKLVTKRQPTVRGAFNDGLSGVLWANQNTVKMETVVIDPVGPVQTNPFAQNSNIDWTRVPPKVEPSRPAPVGPLSIPAPLISAPCTGFKSPTGAGGC
jgi:hypothetical protein